MTRSTRTVLLAAILLTLLVWPRAGQSAGERRGTPAGAKLTLAAQQPQKAQPRRPPPEPDYDVAEMYKMHYNRVNDQYSTGGQPPLEELARLKARGYSTIINLRQPSEHDADAEQKEAKRLGLRYFNIPVVYMDPKEEQATEFLRLMKDPANRPALIHCTMAIRVSAFWMIHRVLNEGWELEKAEEEARKLGPPARHLVRFAREYIAKHKKQ